MLRGQGPWRPGSGLAVRELRGARVRGLVAPLPAAAIAIRVAPARGLALAVDAARARPAHRAPVGHRARAVAVGVAALVVRDVAHGALADQRPRLRGARAVERGVGSMTVTGDQENHRDSVATGTDFMKL